MSNKKRVNTRSLTIYVSEETHQKLVEVTDEINISLTSYIRECIKLKLDLDTNEVEDSEMLFEKTRQSEDYKIWLETKRIKNTFKGMDNY